MTSMIEAASDLHLSDTLSIRVAGVRNNNDGNEVRNIRTKLMRLTVMIQVASVFHGSLQMNCQCKI